MTKVIEEFLNHSLKGDAPQLRTEGKANHGDNPSQDTRSPDVHPLEEKWKGIVSEIAT